MKLNKYKEKIHAACQKGDLEKIKLLVQDSELKAFTYMFLSFGFSIAALYKHQELVSYILALEGVELKDEDMKNVLNVAILQKNLPLISSVLTLKHLNYLDYALLYACRNQEETALEVVQYLKNNFSISNTTLFSMLDAAAWQKSINLGQYLISQLEAYKLPDIEKSLTSNCRTHPGATGYIFLGMIKSMKEKEALDLSLVKDTNKKSLISKI